jgi:hypothetical protein
MVRFTAWGIAGFLESQLSSALRGATGAYSNAYLLSSGMSIVATILVVVLKIQNLQRNMFLVFSLN